MTKTERDRDLTRRCIMEKWALLVVEPGMDEPGCPLCRVYGMGPMVCSGCPICEKTGKPNCEGTPYKLWTQNRVTHWARTMTDWLWALYDELTEKMLAERAVKGAKNGRLSRISCDACGKTPTVIYRMKHENVCDKCYRVRYDPTAEDGHYLVPVVRGGPWALLDAPWEEVEDGVYTSMSAVGYRVRKGEIQREYHGRWFASADAKPGFELRAPKDYTGHLPEGCRWAEGSEPKPYKVLEGSIDGKTWFEIARGNDVDDMSRADTSLLHSTRLRGVDTDGKTMWECRTRHKPSLVRLHVDEPAKPRPKADAIPGLGPLIETLMRTRKSRSCGSMSGLWRSHSNHPGEDWRTLRCSKCCVTGWMGTRGNCEEG